MEVGATRPQHSLYVPSPVLETIADRFRAYLRTQHGVHLADFHALHRFSVEHANEFWLALWRFTDVQASNAIHEGARIDEIPKFYGQAMLNYAENLLHGKGDNEVAIKAVSEDNLLCPTDHTWRDLRTATASIADALLSSGFRRQNVVAVIGSNSPQTLCLLLATAAIDGVFSSFSSDLGPKALEARLRQLNPQFVFIESAYRYNGKEHSVLEKHSAVLQTLADTIKTEVVVIGGKPQSYRFNGSTDYDAFLRRGIGRPLRFEQVPFHRPLVVMFSSGTTGAPKGIVHSHGGLVINGKKENMLHNNFGPKDIYYHYTNISWTLWNILISALFCGTTVVTYDGSPFYPTPEGFLTGILATGVTAFGAGPKYFSELQKRGVKPAKYRHNLDLILSTGAVLTPALSLWMREAFGPICQISFSGGTELCGSFVHGFRGLPSYPGEITVKALGMDVDVWSLDGKPTPDGLSGELVCKNPFPNMPVCFLHDEQGKRYFSAYFETIPGVWTHGDFIKINPSTGGIYILGRSDGVLNPAGVRFGSSEIYSVIERRFPNQIADSLCVGQQRDCDETERVFLFVKMTPSYVGRLQAVEPAIRNAISEDLSRRHTPNFILEVENIPYNVNGKKLEIPVKKLLSWGPTAMSKLQLAPAERAVVETYKKYVDPDLSERSRGATTTAPLEKARL